MALSLSLLLTFQFMPRVGESIVASARRMSLRFSRCILLNGRFSRVSVWVTRTPLISPRTIELIKKRA